MQSGRIIRRISEVFSILPSSSPYWVILSGTVRSLEDSIVLTEQPLSAR